MVKVEEKNIKINKALFPILERIVPDETINRKITGLLLSQAERDSIKYEIMNREFEDKYKMPFAKFEKSKYMKNPAYEIEQDFFDWSMAITGIDELKTDVEKLKTFLRNEQN